MRFFMSVCAMAMLAGCGSKNEETTVDPGLTDPPYVVPPPVVKPSPKKAKQHVDPTLPKVSVVPPTSTEGAGVDSDAGNDTSTTTDDDAGSDTPVDTYPSV